ncbi:APC amino acid permease [Amanita muscaria]
MATPSQGDTKSPAPAGLPSSGPTISHERSQLHTSQGPPGYGTVGTSSSVRISVSAGEGSHLTNRSTGSSIAPTPLDKGSDDGKHGETFDDVPDVFRRLGLFSAINLIFNYVIGVGIYVSPGLILKGVGSVGVSLIMWVIGVVIAAAGTAVYIELGTGLPKSGGDKNYLEYLFQNPAYLMTCIFAAYSTIAKTSAANSVVFGEYVLHALGVQPTPENIRTVAHICLSIVTFIHGTNVKWGILLQDILGAFKIVVLVAISVCGILSLAGVRGFQVLDGYEKPHNFEWKYLWEGTVFDMKAYSTAIYTVLWSFIGYQNANYALSEIKNPIKTLKHASIVGVSIVSVIYIFVNIAFFAVVAKSDILDNSKVIVSLFFRNLFGQTAERFLSFLVALSILGSVFAGQFTQGRVVQELGREGILPFSHIFSSNRPFGAPLAGLFAQYVTSSALLYVTPPGDGFLFIVSLGSYCIFVINLFVSMGLLFVRVKTPGEFNLFQWNPPFRAPISIVLVYVLANVLLILTPFIPPGNGSPTYDHLPYWSHAVVAFGISLVGIAYWYWFAVWHPTKKGYILQRETVTPQHIHDLKRFTFVKIPVLKDLD